VGSALTHRFNEKQIENIQSEIAPEPNMYRPVFLAIIP
jgi:hypothetical protein